MEGDLLNLYIFIFFTEVYPHSNRFTHTSFVGWGPGLVTLVWNVLMNCREPKAVAHAPNTQIRVVR